MPYHGLSAAKIAKEVGCHPNTVRLYEQWGLISPVERNEKGYRLFNAEHLFQMRFARKAYDTPYPGKIIRNSTYQLVRFISSGQIITAQEQVNRHIQLVKTEIEKSEAAIDHVHHWLDGVENNAQAIRMKIGSAARYLELSPDQIRNWERNGLIQIPRDESSGYRYLSEHELSRLRVIRMLRTAGYSTLSILRMLNELDQGSDTDIHQLLNQIPVDEDIQYASDHWLETLQTQLQVANELKSMILTHIVGKL
jgi:DNA-binding transcriptional MerR regulator